MLKICILKPFNRLCLRKWVIISLSLGLIITYLAARHSMILRNFTADKNKTAANNQQASPRYTFSESCNIPVLDPWDKTILQYITDTPKSKCSKQRIDNIFYVDDDGILQENKTAIVIHGVALTACVYDAVLGIEHETIQFGESVNFTAPIFVPHQVFVVTCRNQSGNIIYRSVFVNIMGGNDIQRQQEIGYESDDQLSIIFIGLDSVSRSNAIRKLPMTYKYLTDDLGMHDFKGYMKVDHNTYPNTMALLTGKPMPNNLKRNLKNVKFIWQEEAMKAFVIHHSEDSKIIPFIKDDKFGFQNQPIDYYYRIYDLAMRKTKPILMETIGDFSELCYAGTDRIIFQIDYFKRFMTRYSKRLKFAFFWNIQLSHDDFNTVERADAPLYDLLKWIKTNGHMDRALVFVGSDHGFRLGGASLSHVGRIENHMPFMTVYIPDVLLRRFPWMSENIRYNTDRLVTAYDMHETMKRVIYRDFTLIRPPNVGEPRVKRSVFEKIPLKRSCADAGIVERFCYCNESVSVDINDPVVKTLAKISIKHINKIIENTSHYCRALELQRITDAKLVLSPKCDWYRKSRFCPKNLTLPANEGYGRYTIVLSTSPNDGLFEVILDHKNEINGDGIAVIGEPVRMNIYGNQSHCVTDALLKQICMCYD